MDEERRRLTWSDLEEYARRSREELEAITDPWELLGKLKDFDNLPAVAPFYELFLGLVGQELRAGVVDALLVEGRRVFGATIRGMRKDLKAVEEARRLERMVRP